MGSLLTLASAAARLLKGQGNSEQQLEDLAERVRCSCDSFAR